MSYATPTNISAVQEISIRNLNLMIIRNKTIEEIHFIWNYIIKT